LIGAALGVGFGRFDLIAENPNPPPIVPDNLSIVGDVRAVIRVMN